MSDFFPPLMCHYSLDPKEISHKSVLPSLFFISNYNVYTSDVRGGQDKSAISYIARGITTGSIEIQHTQI